MQQEWLDKWPSSPLFQVTSFRKSGSGGRQLYYLRFRIRESVRYCNLEVDGLLGVSGSPPGPVRGSRLSIWMCGWENIDQARRPILDSFLTVSQPPACYTRNSKLTTKNCPPRPSASSADKKVFLATLRLTSRINWFCLSQLLEIIESERFGIDIPVLPSWT